MFFFAAQKAEIEDLSNGQTQDDVWLIYDLALKLTFCWKTIAKSGEWQNHHLSNPKEKGGDGNFIQNIPSDRWCNYAQFT